MSAGVEIGEHGLVMTAHRPPIPGWPQDVNGIVDRAATMHPDRQALVGRFARYTYRELTAEVEATARALARGGVRAGDRVAACLPNHPDIVIAFLAVMRLGAVWTGVNRVLPLQAKADMLADTGASLYLADPEAAAELGDLRLRPGELREVVTVQAEEPGAWLRQLGAPGTSHERELATVDPFAPAAIAYTSGTTGTPKGVVHSQHNLVLVGAANAQFGIWRSQLRQGVVLSLTILNVVALGPLLIFALGGTCVCIDSSRPVALADWIEREHVESFSSVPTILHDLLTAPDVRTEQLATLTHLGVGGSNCPDSLREAYRDRLGGELLSGYGLTEAPSVLTCQSPDRPVHPHGTGLPLPHLKISIVDPSGQELPVGEIGEVCAGATPTGPWAGVYTPFLGYWNRPDATREAFQDGLLHTGDLGHLDEQGELWLTGRLDEVINRGGSKIHPAEIEQLLAGEAAVAAAAVIGVPDERLGQRVVAFVEPEPGASVDVNALRAHCRAALARYMVPEQFFIVETLPRNAMGKVLKGQLQPSRSA